MTCDGEDEKHGWWIKGKEDRSNRIVVFGKGIDKKVHHIQNSISMHFMCIEDYWFSVWIKQVSTPPLGLISDEMLFCQILLEKVMSVGPIESFITVSPGGMGSLTHCFSTNPCPSSEIHTVTNTFTKENPIMADQLLASLTLLRYTLFVLLFSSVTLSDLTLSANN